MSEDSLKGRVTVSFSYKVKEEICQQFTAKDKSRAAFYGMLSFCKTFTPEQILLQTENECVATQFCNLASFLLESDDAVSQIITQKKNGVSLYSLEIKDKVNDVLSLYNITAQSDRQIDLRAIGKKKFHSFFVAGAFLVCGSVNDPLKEYHLEFVAPDEKICLQLIDILSEIGISAKNTERKGYSIVYIKESENIEDILTYIGAPKSALELMNVKILKDVRNKINRAVNCDSANIEKTVMASERQIKDIELIEDKMGIANLPAELREIAILRVENPDWNLKDLSENINPPISRSGANHRLARIRKIADELRAK